jgi:hypothetical protein
MNDTVCSLCLRPTSFENISRIDGVWLCSSCKQEKELTPYNMTSSVKGQVDTLCRNYNLLSEILNTLNYEENQKCLHPNFIQIINNWKARFVELKP